MGVKAIVNFPKSLLRIVWFFLVRNVATYSVFDVEFSFQQPNELIEGLEDLL